MKEMSFGAIAYNDLPIAISDQEYREVGQKSQKAPRKFSIERIQERPELDIGYVTTNKGVMSCDENFHFGDQATDNHF